MAAPSPRKGLTATLNHVYLCLSTLEKELGLSPTFPEPYPHLEIDEEEESPFFVTLKLAKSGDLRGCIGSLRSRRHDQLTAYAIKSAFHDSRFPPLDSDELDGIECTVSLLVDFEVAKHPFDWTIGIHGLWLEFEVSGESFSGTFLPEVAEEQGWDHEACIAALIRKAGFRSTTIPKEKWAALFRITRYKSSKATSTYREWAKVKSRFAALPSSSASSSVSGKASAAIAGSGAVSTASRFFGQATGR